MALLCVLYILLDVQFILAGANTGCIYVFQHPHILCMLSLTPRCSSGKGCRLVVVKEFKAHGSLKLVVCALCMPSTACVQRYLVNSSPDKSLTGDHLVLTSLQLSSGLYFVE